MRKWRSWRPDPRRYEMESPGKPAIARRFWVSGIVKGQFRKMNASGLSVLHIQRPHVLGEIISRIFMLDLRALGPGGSGFLGCPLGERNYILVLEAGQLKDFCIDGYFLHRIILLKKKRECSKPSL